MKNVRDKVYWKILNKVRGKVGDEVYWKVEGKIDAKVDAKVYNELLK
jgi:hypothetical protein